MGHNTKKWRPTDNSPAPQVAMQVPESVRSLKDVSGSDEHQFSAVVIRQALNTIWIGSNCSEESRNEHYGAVLAAMQAIAPRNEIEGMLAAQMVAVYYAAMRTDWHQDRRKMAQQALAAIGLDASPKCAKDAKFPNDFGKNGEGYPHG